MADLAVVEVALDVRVTVKLEAEQSTPEELRRLVERDPETVRGAILKAVASSRSWPEAGWLDDNRCAFVTEIIDAERGLSPANLGGGFSEAMPKVVR